MWRRFGPYHLARLNGLADVAVESGDEVVGLEVCSADKVYEWDPPKGDHRFTWRTCFRGQGYESIGPRVLDRAVCNVLEEVRPDVIAVNGWSAREARAAMGWAKWRGTAVVLMSESRRSDRRRFFAKEWLKSRIVKSADAALVGGLEHRDYLVDLGFPADRVRLGYDVVDNDYFRTETDRIRRDEPNLRQELNLPERYFLACTRFLPRKNIDGLLRAFAIYLTRSASPPWGLVVLGSGDGEKPIARSRR